MKGLTWKTGALALALAAGGCGERAGGGGAEGSAPRGQAASPATAKKGDPEAARRLFDEAVRLHLAGDEIGWQERLVRLAAEHPDTPHGRAATRRLGSSGQGIMVTGILAAVAIPAFMKYVRRSKAAEAQANLRRMYDGAVAFYFEEQVGPDGTPLPRRFPRSAGPTPARPFCADGEKFQPRADDWAAPGWTELGFALHDPHYFRYEFISEGEGAGARFTARALGDLDCDGVLSTFERVGTIDARGNVSPGAGIFIENELE